MEQAITIWVDESTEIRIGNHDYNLIGYLITNSDKEEFDFLNKLKQARKASPSCWTTLHGSEMHDDDTRQLGLLDRWLKIFQDTEGVYFHTFLYRRNESFIRAGETYEHHFAKQSMFALACKMKDKGYTVNTMFKDVSTLTVLFDRRRAHMAEVVAREQGVEIERLNELEQVYKEQICQQILRISGKDAATTDFTVRFSFLSSECFDGMQLTDVMLYLVRKKIEQKETGAESVYTHLFDKYFLAGPLTKDDDFRTAYVYDKKFNFFQSAA